MWKKSSGFKILCGIWSHKTRAFVVVTSVRLSSCFDPRFGKFTSAAWEARALRRNGTLFEGALQTPWYRTAMKFERGFRGALNLTPWCRKTWVSWTGCILCISLFVAEFPFWLWSACHLDWLHAGPPVAQFYGKNGLMKLLILNLEQYKSFYVGILTWEFAI